jgi:ribosomal-protein-alanine N-acetyltransferase
MHINLSPFPVLTTERLVLRMLDMADRDALFALRSDERVNKYLGRKSPANPEEVDGFINKIAAIIQKHEGVYWAINLKDTSTLIGTICYWNMEPKKDQAEIGFELVPDYQGQGLMQEALTAAINYGFGEIGLKKRQEFELDGDYKYVSEKDADGLAVYVLVKK